MSNQLAIATVSAALQQILLDRSARPSPATPPSASAARRRRQFHDAAGEHLPLSGHPQRGLSERRHADASSRRHARPTAAGRARSPLPLHLPRQRRAPRAAAAARRRRLHPARPAADQQPEHHAARSGPSDSWPARASRARSNASSSPPRRCRSRSSPSCGRCSSRSNTASRRPTRPRSS